MSVQPDGGPAFPNPGEIFIEGPQGLAPQSAWGMDGAKGMSLRAYFAGQYFAGIMACPIQGVVGTPEDVAVDAVRHADALIAELNRRGNA